MRKCLTFRPLETYDWMRNIWNVVFARARGPWWWFVAKEDSEIRFLYSIRTFCISTELNGSINTTNSYWFRCSRSTVCVWAVDSVRLGVYWHLSINGARVWYFVFALFLQFSMLSLLGLAHFCNVEMDIFYLRVEHILLCIPAICHRPRNSIYIPMNIIYQNDKREQAWVIRWVSEREREREYWNKIWWRRGRRSFGVEKLWQQSE